MPDWAGTPVLTTGRLVLRTFRRDDLPRYAALNADPRVLRYLGGKPLSRASSDAIDVRIHSVTVEQWIRRQPGACRCDRTADGATSR